MSDRIAALRKAGVLSALDEQLARALSAMANETRAIVQLSVALVSHQVARGHVCLSLAMLTRGEIAISADDSVDPALLAWPTLAEWRAALQTSALVSGPDGSTPLVLDAQDRLYLRRHHAHERALAAELGARIAEPPLAGDEAWLAARLSQYFGDEPGNLQRAAAELSLRRRFAVISGGPGTGKTATVAKVLALCIEQALHEGRAAPRMHLLAPTGKAAVRMVESIRKAKAQLPCEERVRAAIVEEASTIHRMLAQVKRTAFRAEPGAAPELVTDLVLVDEASMVDLALMGRLFSVLPRHARVILLGDKHQLASVEAGAVLGDICGAGRDGSGAARAPVVHLTRSYRYAADSGIAALASAINAGDAALALDVLASDRYPDVALCIPPKSKGLWPTLQSDLLRGYTPCFTAQTPAEALARFERFRVLCAHRRGPRGVTALASEMLRLFLERGLVTQSAFHFVPAPILVIENDYRNRLWNGDIGMVVQEARDLPLTAAFAAPEGDGIRKLSMARLPRYESALAMSIHKSQGSEVDEVAIVLPEEASPVLTRELLYTAVTRAKRRAVLHAAPSLIELAVRTPVLRSSGLADALYGADPG